MFRFSNGWNERAVRALGAGRNLPEVNKAKAKTQGTPPPAQVMSQCLINIDCHCYPGYRYFLLLVLVPVVRESGHYVAFSGT